MTDDKFTTGDIVKFRKGENTIVGTVATITRDHCIVNYYIDGAADENAPLCQFFAPKKDVWLKGGSYIP